jgi:hypothetical protein
MEISPVLDYNVNKIILDANMFDIVQFKENIVNPVLHDLQMYSKEFAELIVFTCAVESAGGTYVKQIKGPALGIYQIEPSSFTDLWVNFIVRNTHIVNLLTLHFAVHRMPAPIEVVTDLRLATAMCALFYKRYKVKPESSSPDDLWEPYKKYYNTVKGKSEKSKSIKAYEAFVNQK